VIGWGWFYHSTILDDFSRYIIAWKLCTTMKVGDVTETLNLALQASGLDHARVIHRHRLLSDNGPSYISTDLAEWQDKRNKGHVRGAPCHPQTQGKIERWHQTLKNRILLETIIYPAISKPGTTRSPITTTIAVITRAWTISRRPTSTLAADKPSCWNKKGSNEPQSKIVACNTK
jgi:transposase InsO family protein